MRKKKVSQMGSGDTGIHSESDDVATATDVKTQEASGSEDEAGEDFSLPSTLPVLPLRNNVIYPAGIAPLLIGRIQSIQVVNDVMSGNRLVALALQRDPEVEEVGPNDIHQVGTAAVIMKLVKMPNDTLSIVIQGIERVKFERFVSTAPYLVAEVTRLKEVMEEGIQVDALKQTVIAQFQKLVTLLPGVPEEMKILVLNIGHPGRLADFVAYALNISMTEKQEILETLNVRVRLEKVLGMLGKQVSIAELGSKIQEQIKGEIDKTHKEYILRQQLEAIRKELGEAEDVGREIEDLRKKIAESGMPEEARKEAERELNRLARMHPSSAEYTVSRTYLDWLVDMPWNKSTEDNLDIKEARRILDEDHYNLEKVKSRILEFLAVRKFKQSAKGPILCFVGPPGVGKTSLGKSIARALGRQFVRISLGGVRDEAEIRGHRRTYIGALPGRIVQGIKRAGSNNPLFMLDEIDKLASDYRGDPSSALLEVLDPEQNSAFMDHYLNVPFDLSKVMFITTANILDTIPPALRDRMETIRLPGYTEDEKLAIAHRYLIPKQIEECGLEKFDVKFTDEAVLKLIRDYTREAGLRNLERQIGNILRKTARKVAEEGLKELTVTAEVAREYLGPEEFVPEIHERITEPGVALGLAWTPVGGDVLFIEATRMKGEKGMQLTGRLGDVMKESAQAAMSYVRAHASELGVDVDFHSRWDIHIHIPEGATPKDGPSAGVTLAVALISLLTDRKARSDTAMTGEVTLRGKVLPVGGIKEKVLAAKRYGIKRVLLPKQNEKDIEDVPESARREIEFILIDTIADAVREALEVVQPRSPEVTEGGSPE